MLKKILRYFLSNSNTLLHFFVFFFQKLPSFFGPFRLSLPIRQGPPTDGMSGALHWDYRLRVGDYRIFYSVCKQELRVDVLRVMHKDQKREYYEELER